MHLGCNETKVLGEEWQPAQSFAQLQKEVVARAVNPAAVYRRNIARGNFPELVEAAKMIEADVVAVVRGPAQALNPPLVAALFHHVPAVQRIPPALSRLAEKIRWNAGNDFWI